MRKINETIINLMSDELPIYKFNNLKRLLIIELDDYTPTTKDYKKRDKQQKGLK